MSASSSEFVATFQAGKLGLAFARQDDGRVTVQRATMQAEEAGCCAGDQITAVNAQQLTQSMSQDEVTKLIIGAGRPS